MGLILSYPLFSLVYLLYTAYLHVSKKIETAKNTVMTTYSLACAYLLLFSVTLLFKKVHLWASLPISLQVKLNKRSILQEYTCAGEEYVLQDDQVCQVIQED